MNNASSLAPVIINIVVYHHNILVSIIMDGSSIFLLKIPFLLYLFLDIKQKLSITFYL